MRSARNAFHAVIKAYKEQTGQDYIKDLGTDPKAVAKVFLAMAKGTSNA